MASALFPSARSACAPAAPAADNAHQHRPSRILQSQSGNTINNPTPTKYAIADLRFADLALQLPLFFYIASVTRFLSHTLPPQMQTPPSNSAHFEIIVTERANDGLSMAPSTGSRRPDDNQRCGAGRPHKSRNAKRTSRTVHAMQDRAAGIQIGW